MCQLCKKHGYSVNSAIMPKKLCLGSMLQWPIPPKIGNGTLSNWLMDSIASHHVTTDLKNLTLHQPYKGPNDIVIGDGTGLHITYIGSSTLHSSSKSFSLSNVLYVPTMEQNLISFSQFCNTNRTSVEFFPSYFVVKDLITGATLMHGKSRNNVYEWPTTW